MGVELCIVVISLLISITNCERRVYGGIQAKPGQLPHVVCLQIRDLGQCTGTIIHKEWVLSAAHCVVKDGNEVRPGAVQIIAGNTDADKKDHEQKRLSKIIIHHERYKPGIAKHDLSLLKTEKAFEINDYVQKANIFSSNWPQNDDGIWKSCVAAGWGLTEEETITKLKYLDTTAKHGKDSCPCIEKGYQLKRIICLPRIPAVGVCFGDSGGSLLCDNKIVGVAHVIMDKRSCSFVNSPDDKVDCGSKYVYGVYTFICPYISWISVHVPDIPVQPASCKGNLFKSSLTQFFMFHMIFCSHSIL